MRFTCLTTRCAPHYLFVCRGTYTPGTRRS